MSAQYQIVPLRQLNLPQGLRFNPFFLNVLDILTNMKPSRFARHWHAMLSRIAHALPHVVPYSRANYSVRMRKLAIFFFTLIALRPRKFSRTGMQY